MLERSCIVACRLKASSKSIAAEVMDFDQLVAEIAGLEQSLRGDPTQLLQRVSALRATLDHVNEG